MPSHQLYRSWPLAARLEYFASPVVADALLLVVGMALAFSALVHHSDQQAVVDEVEDFDFEVAPAGLAENLVAQNLKAGLIAIDLFDGVVFEPVLVQELVFFVDGQLYLLAQDVLEMGSAAGVVFFDELELLSNLFHFLTNLFFLLLLAADLPLQLVDCLHQDAILRNHVHH